jgi:hypothetical protein
MVINLQRVRDDQEATVIFKDKQFGIKRLLLSLAPLEKLSEGTPDQ